MRSCARCSQLAIEEISGGTVSCEPIPIEKKVVNLIGENEFLEVHALLAQSVCYVNRFGERHIPIVIAVYQQDRGAPVPD